MRLVFAAVLALSLGGCEREPTPQEQAASDAADVAEVEANQEAPPEMVTPQAILYPDIEKHGLFGAGCNFVPESGGLGAILLAQADGGIVKIKEDIVRLAPDKGSDQNPLGSWRKYDGKDVSLTLDLLSKNGTDEGIETVNFPARMTMRDGKDRVVFEAKGTAQCGS